MSEKNFIVASLLIGIIAGLFFMASNDPVHGGGWFTLACFFSFGLIIQILVSAGIMQVTPVNQSPQYSINQMPMNNLKHSYQPTIDYRNYHYQSIIAKVQSSGVTVSTVEEAIKTYSSLFNVGEKAAKPFFQNQFVITTLGLTAQNSTQASKVVSKRNNKTKKFDPNFWDNVSQQVTKNQSQSTDTCAAGGCSKPVSAFDFRCFQCRGRFCSDCESGKSIMCKSCS